MASCKEAKAVVPQYLVGELLVLEKAFGWRSDLFEFNSGYRSI